MMAMKDKEILGHCYRLEEKDVTTESNVGSEK